MNILTFYTRALGSSHTVANKPCQDNGCDYHNDDIYIAIVCDGHGGDSYVRSDKGSELATRIAKEKIIEFISKTPSSIFLNKKGAVTAIPTCNPLRDQQGNQVDLSILSESQQDIVKQNYSYINESARNPEIEKLFRTLFTDIYMTWKDEIVRDSQMNKFSKKEREKLGSLRLEKAYGTTLMAAVRTTDYWFAFHIGDGKLLMCDKLMQWKEPVPWDCNCFLNVTTSLCDHSPVEEFRYAFDGTGEFPVAFTLGSDGIDDTFISNELIHKFYSQILCVFHENNDCDAMKDKLKLHLSELSKRGSHDDMSVAAIIDLEQLPIAVEYYKVISEVRQLSKERKQREEIISSKEKALDKCKTDIDKIAAERDFYAASLWDWWIKQLCAKSSKQEEYKELSDKYRCAIENCNAMCKELVQIRLEFEDWLKISKKRVESLRIEAEAIKNQVYPIGSVCTKNNHSNDASTVSGNNECQNLNISEELTQLEREDPTLLYGKAIQAPPTDEELQRMDEESEAQAKEILQNNDKIE